MSERITLKEFRAWLDGLLSGRDVEREALPTRDQWQKILAKLEAIDDPANMKAPAPASPVDRFHDAWEAQKQIAAEQERVKRMYLGQQMLGGFGQLVGNGGGLGQPNT